jgi:hypothetical protein
MLIDEFQIGHNYLCSSTCYLARANTFFLPLTGDSSVGIATGYELEDRSSIPESGKRFFSNSQRPDRLWGSPNLLPIGYSVLFSWG